MSLRHALTEQLKAPLRKRDDLALVLVELAVRLGHALRDARYQAADVVRLANEPDEALVLGLDELQQGPDGDVLERGVPALEEAAEVAVDSPTRLGPVLGEDGVITYCINVSTLRLPLA